MKVLVPVDGSDNSVRAAEYVLEMAKKHPSMEVTLLAVACHYDAAYFADSWVGEEIPNEKCRQIFSKGLEKVKKFFDDAGVQVKTELLTGGDPGKVIVTHAEEKDYDKVVIGSRGLSPFRGAVLGSVTYKVLNSLNIPVTVVK